MRSEPPAGPKSDLPKPSSTADDPKCTLSPEDRIIIVMGLTGAGKSTFVNYATEKDDGKMEYKSPASEIRAVRTKHPDDQGSVVFVDTPGFDDTNRAKIFDQIASWFGKACKEKVSISAIVHLHHISDNRTTGAPLNNEEFASIGAKGAMPRVILANTAWSEPKGKNEGKKMKGLKKTFWMDMIKLGPTVQRFSDSRESAWKIIGELPAVQGNAGGSIPGPEYTLSSEDRVIVVMGPTGAGKSTFIEYATQQSGKSIGHTLQSETSAIRAVRTKHPGDKASVIFVDTPGFDDTHRSDIDILAQIAGWFVKVYKEKVPISAIIYLHRISDNRMAGSPLKNLQMFASMCGHEAMPRVTLATTMWSETKPETGARREIELKATFWAGMITEGCTVERFDDSYQSAWQIVGELPSAQENVILSREILDDKKNLNETAAGVKLTEELTKLIADQKTAARRMEEQANSQNNPVLVAELQLRHEEIEKKIGRVAAQLQQLHVPFVKKFLNRFTGKKARESGVYVPGNR